MIVRAIAFILALAAGITASQVPEFAQQYRQRLGGAIDELARVIAHFDEDAAKSGYSRAAAIAVMNDDDEQLVRDQAGRLQDAVTRYDRLVSQQVSFAQAGPFGRLFAFGRDFDGPLVQRTLDDFEPAVPTTIEGVVFAGGTFVLVYFVIAGLGALFRRRRRHRRAA